MLLLPACLSNSAKTDHEPYRYEPLYKTTPSTRLVRILPPNESGELRLDLEVVSLAAAANDYSAVSYTWGLGPAEHRVWIGDKFLLLRSSIWRFLKHCCKTEVHGKTMLWIDSICIDQNNVLEKNFQVQLMKDIFQNAEKVLVWLSEASESGIDKVLGQCCYEDFPRWLRTNKDRKYCLSYTFFNGFLDEAYSTPGKDALAEAVDALYKCRYFTRLWIIQEFAFARRLLFVLGACTFRAYHVQAINHWRRYRYDAIHDPPMSNTPARQEYIMRQSVIEQLFYFREVRKPLPLAYLLVTFSGHHCQNPKDRVYGFLGFIDPSNTLLVDYEITNEELFAQCIELLTVGDRESDYYHRWGYNARILSGALDVSTRSCLARSNLTSAGHESLHLFSRRFELPILIGVRMVPLVPVLVSPNTRSFKDHQFMDLESGEVFDERFFRGADRSAPEGFGPEGEGLVELVLSRLLSLVLGKNTKGHLSVKYLLPEEIGLQTVVPCQFVPCHYAEGLPEGLIDNLERQLAKYAQNWNQVWYYHMHDLQPPMSISCSIFELLQLIELSSSMSEQIKLRESQMDPPS